MSAKPGTGNAVELYAPGAIRSVSDREHTHAVSFLKRYPEFERLGHDGVIDLAETYLDEADHEERSALNAEGVPAAPYGFDDIEAIDDGSDYR